MADRKRVVEAQEFILRDHKGRERAKLGLHDNGHGEVAILTLCGKDETPRLMLTVNEDGKPELALVNQKGAPGMVLSLLRYLPGMEGTALLMNSEDERQGAMLFVPEDGLPRFVLRWNGVEVFNSTAFLSLAIPHEALPKIESVRDQLSSGLPGRPSLQQIAGAYCTAWISGEIPSHTFPTDPEALGVVGEILRKHSCAGRQ